MSAWVHSVMKGRSRFTLKAGTILATLVLVSAAALLPVRADTRLCNPGVYASAGVGSHHLHGSPEQSDLPLQFAVWWEEVRRLARE
ncbi:MAG: hypothetical protein ACP5NF_11675, partial [Thermoanaerobaculum sp.]